ncbi:MAG: hypothetical protein ABSB84_04150 [Verrucomicrobiota bacterium]
MPAAETEPFVARQFLQTHRAARATRKDLAPNPALPEDTRLWAALQLAGGGIWGGCVYDPDQIIAALKAGQQV